MILHIRFLLHYHWLLDRKLSVHFVSASKISWYHFNVDPIFSLNQFNKLSTDDFWLSSTAHDYLKICPWAPSLCIEVDVSTISSTGASCVFPPILFLLFFFFVILFYGTTSLARGLHVNYWDPFCPSTEKVDSVPIN